MLLTIRWNNGEIDYRPVSVSPHDVPMPWDESL